MTKYAVLFWNPKHTKLLQVFGPYLSEAEAERAVERLADWPSFTDGVFEVERLYADPEIGPQPAPVIPYHVNYPVYVQNYPMITNAQITWNSSKPIQLTAGTTYTIT